MPKQYRTLIHSLVIGLVAMLVISNIVAVINGTWLFQSGADQIVSIGWPFEYYRDGGLLGIYHWLGYNFLLDLLLYAGLAGIILQILEQRKKP